MERVGGDANTVGRWRRRFAERRLDGLYDEPRSGAPRKIGDENIAEIIGRTLERIRFSWNHIRRFGWGIAKFDQEGTRGAMTELEIADCINDTCPWSGEPVQAGSLTEHNGEVVGFCNPGCRDKFETALRHFEKAKASRGAA